MTHPTTDTPWRESSQPLIPVTRNLEATAQHTYNHIPSHGLGDGKIFNGYDSLVTWITEQKTVIIDGYVGVFFETIQQQIDLRLKESGLNVNWHLSADYLKPEAELDSLMEPYLGEKGSVWGKKTGLKLVDLFKPELSSVQQDQSSQINIVIGLGASVSGWDAPVVYFDIPKNEIQYRMRAGSVKNIGKSQSEAGPAMYKRFYFVDWVVADQHRNELLSKIAIVADGQWQESITWLHKESLVAGLAEMSKTVFRVRPWFEKDHGADNG
jgi:hypothetical protein